MTTRAQALVSHTPNLSLVRDPDLGPVVMGSAGDHASNVGASVDALTGGRISLGLLAGIVVVLGLFYISTKEVQGGG